MNILISGGRPVPRGPCRNLRGTALTALLCLLPLTAAYAQGVEDWPNPYTHVHPAQQRPSPAVPDALPRPVPVPVTAPVPVTVPVPAAPAGLQTATLAGGDHFSSPDSPRATPPTEPTNPAAVTPVLQIGAGDAIALQVYGRPEMNVTTYVADDGSINVPLAGVVHVGGMSPAQAASAVAKALQDGQFLVHPQVTITLSQYRSQQVSVLGEVRTPGRYVIESRTGVLDLLAQAGGQTENSASVIYVLRPGRNGAVQRFPIDLASLRNGSSTLPTLPLRGGDSLYVPAADHFYIYGEVQAPNAYRLETGMTVVQALTRGGGVTARGSAHRVEITRQTADGKHVSHEANLFETIEPNDVIRVKERIF